MARSTSFVYVGTGRFVMALDSQSGEEIWRTKLPSSSSSVITLLLNKQQLFAGCSGRAYCLDPRTGSILWENGLPRTGFGVVLMTMEGANVSSVAAAAAAKVAADAQAAASA